MKALSTRVTGASFWGTTVSNTNFSDAVLKKCKKLTQGQIDQAVGNSKTQLPKDLERPDHWKDE